MFDDGLAMGRSRAAERSLELLAETGRRAMSAQMVCALCDGGLCPMLATTADAALAARGFSARLRLGSVNREEWSKGMRLAGKYLDQAATAGKLCDRAPCPALAAITVAISALGAADRLHVIHRLGA